MVCFSWLHLTDFHQGMSEQDWIWPNVKESFFEDLKKLYDKCGPWDLVLFTGDLTQRGSAEEFQKVDEILAQLWEQFDKLGCSPKLLAVPGNHDLVRPDEHAPPVIVLQGWDNQPNIQNEFWSNEQSPYRQVVTEAFKNYTHWLTRQPLKVDDLHLGLLPGDCSATIEKGAARLGIVGLNTSFLQLTGNDYEGKLVLHTRQFHQACGGDGPKWVKEHHTCLLMTHHPPTWLTSESREHLNGGIVAQGRFAAHLCGHLHETASQYIAEGGVQARYIWQSCSLCGLEFFYQSAKKIQRSHGYSVGTIELNENQGMLTFWPRAETRLQGGVRTIVPEYARIELDDEHTIPRKFELLNPYPLPFQTSTNQHDIFVSYAGVDNQPSEWIKKGWVTELVNELRNHLGKKLGRTNYSLWMDNEPRGIDPITPHIAQQLKQSEILLLILSHGYLASVWCQWELRTFLTLKGLDYVFIVELESAPPPEELKDLYRYTVLASHTNNQLDYQKLGDLARQLINKIYSLRKEPIPVPTYLKDIPTTTLFLAEVSDDLEESRDEVKRFLEQQGLQILPKKIYSLKNIQQYLDQDLAQCKLFVQLLSEKSALGFPYFQYERAQAAQLPILQWRNNTFDLNQVSDLDHQALLLNSTVIASTLVEFQQQIINQLKPKEIIPKNSLLVFINVEKEDLPLAEQIQAVLELHNIGYSLSLLNNNNLSASQIEKYLRQNLLGCDAVIILYGATSVVWVHEQVLYCRRIQAQREQPFKVFAVCDKPSVNKPTLPIKLPELHLLKCPTLQAKTCLPEFIRILGQ